MTVGQKMHQTLNNLRSSITDMKNYALETQDQNAKKMYSEFAQQLQNIVNGFEGRVNYAEQQEPQYQVYKNARQQQQQQQ